MHDVVVDEQRLRNEPEVGCRTLLGGLRLAYRRDVTNDGRSVMGNRWSGLTIDCRDPSQMSNFWGALLDIAPSNEHGDDPGWATLGSRSDATPRLTFQRVPEAKSTKVRIHLDVQVDDIDAGRRQVEELGGRWSGVRHDYDEGVVLVMLDPEDHEFCLVQYFD